MVQVHFTSALKRFHPDLDTIEVNARTVADILEQIDQKFPGFSDYIVEENHSLRQHVNIFINDAFIKDRKCLSDRLSPGDHVHIIQALSGG